MWQWWIRVEKNLHIKDLSFRAMSLIEVMVVLLIIGMIMGLVGVGVVAQLNKAKVKTAQTQAKSLRNAVKMYQLDVSKIPGSMQDLVTNPGLGNKWKGPYVEDGILPKDPWGNDYVLETPGRRGTEFSVMSYGANGSPGGSDLDADIYDLEEEE